LAHFLTIAGALAAVTSVLIGGTPGLAVQAGTGGARRVSAAGGDHRRWCAGRTPRAAASDPACGAAASISTTASRQLTGSRVGAGPVPMTMSKVLDQGSQIPDPWRRMANSE
jgi:hypothetical protein